MGPAFAGTTTEDKARLFFNDVFGFTFQQPTQLRILAARFARVLPTMFRPFRKEGAGNAGRSMRPQPRVVW
jgi:hypothetical protein